MIPLFSIAGVKRSLAIIFLVIVLSRKANKTKTKKRLLVRRTGGKDEGQRTHQKKTGHGYKRTHNISTDVTALLLHVVLNERL